MGRDQCRALLLGIWLLKVFVRTEGLTAELDMGCSVLHLKIEIEFAYRMTL